MATDPEPFDLSRVTTRPIDGRAHLVNLSHLPEPAPEGGSFAQFLDSLPPVLAAENLRALVGHVVRAHRGGHPVAIAMGGHVVKTGCAPVLLDLVRRGIITSIHMAGSTAIHDFELASAEQTSEDVAAELGTGRYGMSDETGRAFAVASRRAVDEGIGLGRALGLGLLEAGHAANDRSFLAEAARLGLPCTVHVAVGTDTVHMHPDADGATIGGATHLDFRIGCSVVTGMAHGVWINIGSAVVMPEVFLKMVTVARNTGHPLPDMTTANLDMLQHYRPLTNVVRRPSERGYALTGHHEIMVPLLRMAILEGLRS